MRPHPFLIVALVGALLGFVFASVSTYDFARHLDRQVHGVHCSFVPGLDEAESGGSDCEVTLMSPYSSVARTTVWGGIPISLPAMSVFAFLFFFAIDLLLSRRQKDMRSTSFFLLATLLPVVTSGVMGYISLGELDAACKLCIGIYTASGLAFFGAIGLWVAALQTPQGAVHGTGFDSDPAWASEGDDAVESTDDIEAEWEAASGSKSGGKASFAWLAGAFGIGLLFVAIPVGAYVATAPDHSEFIGTCGTIDEEPEPELLVPLGTSRQGVPALEVFDPLCPACRGFEQHLETTQFGEKLSRRAVLFPLDQECNWMLDRSVHPGACAVSEAVICADARSNEVIEWAFENQEKIREAAEASPGAGRDMAKKQFPGLADCIGSPKARQTLNRSLRWAVDNNLRVLTPQFYVDGVRLCDEDVDLGLEFALSRMLELHDRGVLRDRARQAASKEGSK